MICCRWDKVNEAWEVLWYEHNKLNGKPFLVRHHGINGAKKAAMAFVTTLTVRDSGIFVCFPLLSYTAILSFFICF